MIDKRLDDIPRRAESLGLDTFLPEETVAIRGEARAFAERVLRPAARRLNTTPESADSFPRAEFDAIAQAGLYAIPFAQDVGGRGLAHPTLATVTVLAELAYFAPSFASALYDGQAILVGQTLNNAQPAIRDAWLPKLIAGEFVGCFATSEPAASTDLSVEALRTTAEAVDGGFRVNGTKRWITNSPAGDVMVALCRTGDRLNMLLIDMRAEGVSVSAPDIKMGNKAQLTADVTFKHVFVPEANLIGTPGKGLRTAITALVQGRMGIGAIGVAMAQSAFDFASQYMTQRQVFGQALAGMQHWQYRFAEHALAIEQAQNLVHKAALAFDRGESADTIAAMAKLAGSRLAVDVARDAIQVCGAYGFVQTLSGPDEHWPLEAIYRDAKIGEIYEGANEVQQWVIARQIFGREMTG